MDVFKILVVFGVIWLCLVVLIIALRLIKDGQIRVMRRSET